MMKRRERKSCFVTGICMKKEKKGRGGKERRVAKICRVGHEGQIMKMYAKKI